MMRNWKLGDLVCNQLPELSRAIHTDDKFAKFFFETIYIRLSRINVTQDVH